MLLTTRASIDSDASLVKELCIKLYDGAPDVASLL